MKIAFIKSDIITIYVIFWFEYNDTITICVWIKVIRLKFMLFFVWIKLLNFVLCCEELIDSSYMSKERKRLLGYLSFEGGGG